MMAVQRLQARYHDAQHQPAQPLQRQSRGRHVTEQRRLLESQALYQTGDILDAGGFTICYGSSQPSQDGSSQLLG
jgi:hypothetical protein